MSFWQRRVAVAGMIAGLAGLMASSGCGRVSVPQTSDIKVLTTDGAASMPQLPAPTYQAADWPQWRGPHQDGVAQAQNVPVEWDSEKNVVWKSRLPGRGHASPIILGDRVFVATADEGEQIQSVLALDRASGKWIWQTELFQGGFDQATHRENTQASSTLASDGTLLFATFLNDRRIWCSALSLEGDEVWRQDVGGFLSNFGFSGSPIVYQSYVILAADHDDGGFIAALRRDTGDIVWRRKREACASYASPRVVTLAGRDQVVLCGCRKVTSYDPATGELLWSTDGTARSTVGTPVVSDDLVLVSGGYPEAETLALDGSGRVAWRQREKVYVPSLLAADDVVYLVQDNGVLRCRDARSGKELWKQRIPGEYRASPLMVDNRIYITNMSGTTTVFRHSPQSFERLAENRLGTEGFASPAISGDQMFLRVGDDSSGRREDWLYCLGQAAGQ